MDFGAVLRRSAQITWRFKALWIFGILAACGTSRGGGGGGGGGGGAPGQYDFGPGEADQFERFIESIPVEVIVFVIVGLVLLILFLGLIFLLLGVLGQAGLIGGFVLADEGQAASLSAVFEAATDNFLRILAIRIIFAVAGLIIALPIVIGIIALVVLTLGLGLLCLIPLLCLLVPLGIAVGLYSELTQVAAVVDDLPVFESFRRAWLVFRENVGPIIVMALILIIGGGVVSFLLALPIFFVAVPAITGLLIGTDVAIGGGLGLAALCFVIYLPVVILLSGVLQTFITGSWTITYRRLTDAEGAEALA